jgi:hypothetical protein
MSANVEVGQRRASGATPVSVVAEALAREEGRCPGEILSFDLTGQGCIEVLDLGEPNRYLGIHDRIDQYRPDVHSLSQSGLRPCQPRSIFGEYVKQDARIDERASAALEGVTHLLE